MAREEIIGDCRLILGDCRDVLPTLRSDLLLTDPPYGIGKDGQKQSSGVHGGRKAYDFRGWDSERPSKVVFDMLMRSAREHVIWGGNYFADMLPASGKWFVWDKGQRINQSDGELAYTSLNGALRIYTLNRVSLLTDGAEHPTQKPVAVMTWCLNHFPNATSVLDPFMGSGTTGVACARLGRKFIGIEIEPKYYEIALRRIEQAYRQPDLFVAPPAADPQDQRMVDMFAEPTNG